MKLRPLALVAACGAAAAGFIHVRRAHEADAVLAQRVAAVPSLVPDEFRRRGDCTFLTIPEWNLVFGPEEYADFMATSEPSRFPYLGQVGQFWDCYRTVYARVAGEYPYNGDYQLMDSVIGVSTTVEYGLKCAYERTIGRVTELTRSAPTAEDRLAAEVARDYVAFIKVEPWYKFDFATPLGRLWADTGLSGPDALRKWERKYFLTSEYAAKFAYAWVIKKGSEQAFAEEKPGTTVVLDRLPDAVKKEYPAIREVRRFADGAVLATLPRYQDFMPNALGLATHGVGFRDIAGNQGIILVSLLADASFKPPLGTALLIQPQLTHPKRSRFVLEIPIPQLSEALLRLQRADVVLEHIYDF